MAEREWATAELVPWFDEALTPAAVADEAYAYAATRITVFLYQVEGGRVSYLDKRTGSRPPPELEPLYARLAVRAEHYRAFFEDALAAFGVGHRGVFALDVDDLPADEPGIPVFVFQKPRGSRRLLVPDLDFLVNDFYAGADYFDALPFGKKTREAASWIRRPAISH